ncbi:hypothetical protein ACLOJK_038757 [Asimina triloba]
MAAGDESSGEGADDRSKPLERTTTMMRFQIQRCNRPMSSTHEPAAVRLRPPFPPFSSCQWPGSPSTVRRQQQTGHHQRRPSSTNQTHLAIQIRRPQETHLVSFIHHLHLIRPFNLLHTNEPGDPSRPRLFRLSHHPPATDPDGLKPISPSDGQQCPNPLPRQQLLSDASSPIHL